MKIVLYIPTAYTENNKPSPWLAQRLDAAIEYFLDHSQDECTFLPSGRGPSSEMFLPMPEAEVCKRYILKKLPQARIIKEDICVETAGGFAFSKPIIEGLKPDKVIIFNSQVLGERVKFLAKKIFGPKLNCEFILLNDELSKNPKAQDKEPRAMVMFEKLFKDIEDGDDSGARNILLYNTPFYFKGIIDAEEFFNDFWPGGLENKNLTEDSKEGK